MSKSGNDLLQNYCMVSQYSNTVLFPFGWGALANHAGVKQSNMELDWFWWDQNKNMNTSPKGEDFITYEDKIRKMNSTLTELSQAPFAQLDIRYKASKDIKNGDELTFFYGNAWMEAWTLHLSRVAEWNIEKRRLNKMKDIKDAMKYFKLNSCVGESCENKNEGKLGNEEKEEEGEGEGKEASDVAMPKFRFFIEASPDLMFPKWRDAEINNEDLGSSMEFDEIENHSKKLEVQDPSEDIDSITNEIKPVLWNGTEDGHDIDVTVNFEDIDDFNKHQLNINNLANNCDDYGSCKAIYSASGEYL